MVTITMRNYKGSPYQPNKNISRKTYILKAVYRGINIIAYPEMHHFLT
jgi:hypothetical protein